MLIKKKKYHILIAFYSFSGHTEKLVKYIKEGAESMPNVEVEIKRIPELLADSFFEEHPQFIPAKNRIEKKYEVATIQDLIEADGIILGSPVRFGQVASQVKQFIDGLSPIYIKNQMVNKPFSVFTSGGSDHGGMETTLLSMIIPFIWMGMVPVGIPYPMHQVRKGFDAGCPLGATFHTGIDGNNTIRNDDKKVARVLGARLAMMTEMLDCNCKVNNKALKKFKEV
jgi:NAD(P)H dehydrogenase (quinone)